MASGVCPVNTVAIIDDGHAKDCGRTLAGITAPHPDYTHEWGRAGGFGDVILAERKNVRSTSPFDRTGRGLRALTAHPIGIGKRWVAAVRMNVRAEVGGQAAASRSTPRPL